MRFSPGVPALRVLRLSAIAVLLACLAVPARPAAGQTCTSFVNATDGDDSNPGTQILPWRSIEYAFEQADIGETVCVTAGEYFYGPDADGIDLDIDGKSVDFVIRAFAGESEVRLSEKSLRVDAGDGRVRFLAGTADGLTLGRGIVNSDDPGEPGLLNFMHSLELVSGTLDVTDVRLTIEESVGNPSHVNPDNPDKTAPPDAAVTIGNGRLAGSPVWAPAERMYIYGRSGPGQDAQLDLPDRLSGSTVVFTHAGTVVFDSVMDAGGAVLRFAHTGSVVFEADATLDAATTDLEWSPEATGELTFQADLSVTSSSESGGELVFAGAGRISIGRLLSVASLDSEQTARVVHDGTGLMQVQRFETGLGSGIGPLSLALVQEAGTLELGTPGTTMRPPGPLENHDVLMLAGPISPGVFAPYGVVNIGRIDIGTFDMVLDGNGAAVYNSGEIHAASGASAGGVYVTADASIDGGGSMPSLTLSAGTLQMTDQMVAGSLSVTGNAVMSLTPDAVLRVTGDVDLQSDPAFSSGEGTVVLAGPEQTLSILSGAPFPRFRIPGSAVTVAPGTTALPGITLESGGLSAQMDSDLDVTGMLRVEGGSASLNVAATLRFEDGAYVQSGVLLIESGEPVEWSGVMHSGSGTIDFNAPGVAPVFGSTIEFTGTAGIVLPSLLLGDSGANVHVGTRVEVRSGLLLSSGVILFEEAGSLHVSGNLTRSSGRFEPINGAPLVLDGSGPQVISGFSDSVLPSLRLEGAAVSASEPLTILGDVAVAGGSTTIGGGSLVNVSGALRQSSGLFRLAGSSSLFAADGLSLTGGAFETGTGSIRSSGDITFNSEAISTGGSEFILDGGDPVSVSTNTDVSFRSITVRGGTAVTATGSGTLASSGGLSVRAGARLNVEGADIVMTGATAPPVLSNAGRIGGSGYVRLSGPDGPDRFVLSGAGLYGAISVETKAGGQPVALTGMDTLRIGGTIRFMSGSVDAGGRVVRFVSSGATPGIVLNLEGQPDGRGFRDSTGPLDFGSDGASYDLTYVGSLTTPWSAAGEFIPGFVRNLTISSPDAVNSPPVFGVSLGAPVRIPGRLTVASASLLRLTSGAVTLSGEDVLHRLDGRIVGSYDIVVEGAGATLLSVDSTAFVRSLVLAAPPNVDAAVVSGLASAERMRVDSGKAAIGGARDLALSGSLTMTGGSLRLSTGMDIGSGASGGVLAIQAADLLLDDGSRIGLPRGGSISADENASVTLTPAARAVQDGRTGFIILGDESSIAAPGGIPRLSLDPVSGEAGSDDIFLSGDLEVTDAFVQRNGDVYVGSNVLRLSGGFVEYDADGAAFDGQRDEIVGDVSGGGGVIEVTGSVDFRMGSDLSIQGATVIVDAPGRLVRLVSTTADPRQLHVAALPLELRAGTIDLGANDLRVTGSSANLLLLGDVDVIASSNAAPPAVLHPLLRQEPGTFPLRDRDFGEIVVDGSGNASLAVTHPVTIPALRMDGTVRLPVANEPLSVSKRLVFGRDGATVLAESATDLRLASGAAVIRRGEGTLARVPVFEGPIDVFYDLDDGDLTGTDTGFEGTLVAGLELPATVRRLGVLAGGTSAGVKNRVQLSSDVTVGRTLVVYGGVLDRRDWSVMLSSDALLALDQVDGDAPAAMDGVTAWSASGEVDVLLRAAIERIDPDASILPPGVKIDSLIVSLGRSDGPAVTVRQRIPLALGELVVEAPGARGTYRFDGMDVLAERGVTIRNAAMLTSSLALLETGTVLSIGPGAELSGSVEARVGSDFDLHGQFGGLSLKLGGDFHQTGSVAGATRITFTGTRQTWTIPEGVQTGNMQLAMNQPPTGPPVLRLVSASGAVRRTLTVNGTLQLDSGLLDTGDHRVRLGGVGDGYERSPNAGSAGNPPSHVIGTIVRRADAERTDPITFPVGDEAAYRPLIMAFPTPLLSDTDLSVAHSSLPYTSRNGLPVESPDGVLLQDASGFSWFVTSSVNFAQSQPVTVTAVLDAPLAGDAEEHRLISRAGSDFSAPWKAVGGSPVVSFVEDGLHVRSVAAAGLLAPDGVTLGIGVPDLLSSGDGLLQVLNMAPGAARDVLAAGERVLSSLSPGTAGGTIAFGLDESGAVPITLTIRDALNSTISTNVETTIRADRVTVVGLTAAGDGHVETHVAQWDLTAQHPPDRVGLGFMHLDPEAGEIRIARDHAAASPIFTAAAPGTTAGPVQLPAEPLVLVPVPGVQGAFDVEEFRVDLTSAGGAHRLLVAADASLFGAAVDSPFLAVVAADGSVQAATVVTHTVDADAGIPTTFRLGGNYPNPFHARTTLTFDLPQTADVRLVVVDMLGRVVRRVDAGRLEAGASRRIGLDADGLAAGVYVYRIEAATNDTRHVGSGMMVIVR